MTYTTQCTSPGPARSSYSENGTEPVASFKAFDEGEHAIRWSLSGRDDHLFTIDSGVLAFKEAPQTMKTRSLRQIAPFCR